MFSDTILIKVPKWIAINNIVFGVVLIAGGVYLVKVEGLLAFAYLLMLFGIALASLGMARFFEKSDHIRIDATGVFYRHVDPQLIL